MHPPSRRLLGEFSIARAWQENSLLQGQHEQLCLASSTPIKGSKCFSKNNLNSLQHLPGQRVLCKWDWLMALQFYRGHWYQGIGKHEPSITSFNFKAHLTGSHLPHLPGGWRTDHQPHLRKQVDKANGKEAMVLSCVGEDARRDWGFLVSSSNTWKVLWIWELWEEIKFLSMQLGNRI